MLDVGPDRLSCRRLMLTVRGRPGMVLVEISVVGQRYRAVLAVKYGWHKHGWHCWSAMAGRVRIAAVLLVILM
jgi:hypothetical protein